MDFGLIIPHMGAIASAAFIRAFSSTAEDVGFGALWAGDHMVRPYHTDSEYTLARKPATFPDNAVPEQLSPNYEMMTTLSFIAGFTNTIRLGTSVAVLPIRNAVANARQVASLDVYSGGRVVYGVGVGWLREEAEAMGMPWDERGRRTEEHVELLRALWYAEGELVEFHGRYHDLPLMDPEPRPVQRPVPILVGGHSDVALRRAGRIGDGWIAASMSPDRLGAHWAKVCAAAEARSRDPGSLMFVATLPFGWDPANVALIDAYADLGVDHLMVPLHTPVQDAKLSPEVMLDEMRAFATDVMPHYS